MCDAYVVYSQNYSSCSCNILSNWIQEKFMTYTVPFVHNGLDLVRNLLCETISTSSDLLFANISYLWAESVITQINLIV